MPAGASCRRGACKFSADRPTPHHNFDSTLGGQIPTATRLHFATIETLDIPHLARSSSLVTTAARMADSLDYIQICESCPPGDGWGPSVTTDTTLNGVPYAPFSKGDKLGRMADWTSEGKDRERGGRMQYNRNYRGRIRALLLLAGRGSSMG